MPSKLPTIKLRLPLKEGAAIRALAASNNRPLNTELFLAVRAHLDAHMKEEK